MQYVLIFFMFSLLGQVKQETELLNRQLPVFVQVNGFSETTSLEALLRVQLGLKKFNTISKEELDNLIIAEAKKGAQRNRSQVKKDMDINALTINTVASLSPVAQKLTVTFVLDNQGRADSCYYAVSKHPFLSKKRLAYIQRRYIADSTVRRGDLEWLAKEIIALTTE